MHSRPRFSFNPRPVASPAGLFGPTEVQLSKYISMAGCRITASTMSEKRPATCGRIASRM